jgi:hypothetical protein
VTYDYRGARDRIFGIVRGEDGKVTDYVATPATMSERVLLLALIEFAPNIEPSTESLALMVGTDERSVRRLLRSCEGKGLLLVEHRTGRRSRYTITCNPGFIVPPDAESPLTSSPPTPDAESSPPRTLSPPKQTTKAVKEADKKIARSASRTQGSLKLVPDEPKETSDHVKLRDLYFARFESVRGMPPPFDGRDGKAIKDLLAKCSVDQAAEAIEGAFRCYRSDTVTIRAIASDPAQFIGAKAPGRRNEPQPKQPNGGSYKPPVASGSEEF